MTSFPAHIDLVGLRSDQIPLIAFKQEAVARRCPRVRQFSVLSDGPIPPIELEVIGDHDSLTSAFGEVDGVLVYYQCSEKRHHTVFLAGDGEPVERVEAWIRARLPEPSTPEDDPSLVNFLFLSLGAHGEVNTTLKQLHAPAWEQIATNYPKGVREQCEHLARMGPPEIDGGKLVLLHGIPGAGKTYLVRALAREWRSWCDAEYILDPEHVFARAHYLSSAFLRYQEHDRWRLLIMEDTGEFLRKSAANQIGAGFSRLLNLADGILGQGLRLIVLLTTNEPLSELHPAITRPGRCLANFGFEPFPPEEASEWLGERVHEPMPLAALYERRNSSQITTTKTEEPRGNYL